MAAAGGAAANAPFPFAQHLRPRLFPVRRACSVLLLSIAQGRGFRKVAFLKKAPPPPTARPWTKAPGAGRTAAPDSGAGRHDGSPPAKGQTFFTFSVPGEKGWGQAHSATGHSAAGHSAAGHSAAGHSAAGARPQSRAPAWTRPLRARLQFEFFLPPRGKQRFKLPGAAVPCGKTAPLFRGSPSDLLSLLPGCCRKCPPQNPRAAAAAPLPHNPRSSPSPARR